MGWSTDDDRTVLGISQISVLSEFGRQGIGTRLMNTVLDRARAQGYQSVVLATQVGVPWNEPWYRRLGFESVEPADRTDSMREDVATQQRGGIDWEHRVWMKLDLVSSFVTRIPTPPNVPVRTPISSPAMARSGLARSSE